jgi:hypothetical protein
VCRFDAPADTSTEIVFEVRGSKSGRRARVVETVFLGGARLRADIREFPPLAMDEPEIAGS